MLCVLLCVSLSGDWVLWVKGSCVPALTLMAVTPLAVYALFPPRIKKTPEVCPAAMSMTSVPASLPRCDLSVLVPTAFLLPRQPCVYIAMHQAPVQARKALAGMGPLSYGEAATLAVMVFAVTFWICGSYIKAMPQLNTTAVALMALSLLLLAGVLTWEDCLAAAFAWGGCGLHLPPSPSPSVLSVQAVCMRFGRARLP